ncbi:MAG: hypothetical protein AB1458_08280 [Bacteroidota bacterium]
MIFVLFIGHISFSQAVTFQLDLGPKWKYYQDGRYADASVMGFSTQVFGGSKSIRLGVQAGFYRLKHQWEGQPDRYSSVIPMYLTASIIPKKLFLPVGDRYGLGLKMDLGGGALFSVGDIASLGMCLEAGGGILVAEVGDDYSGFFIQAVYENFLFTPYGSSISAGGLMGRIGVLIGH